MWSLKAESSLEVHVLTLHEAPVINSDRIFCIYSDVRQVRREQIWAKDTQILAKGKLFPNSFI
jgi:hypothetical protein